MSLGYSRTAKIQQVLDITTNGAVTTMTRIIKLVKDELAALKAKETWPSAEQNRQFDALTNELKALKDRESLVAEVYVECHRTPSDGPIAESERKLRAYIINLIQDGA